MKYGDETTPTRSEALLSLPEIISATPNASLPRAWYVCGDVRSAENLLFDAARSDDLYALRVAVENGADIDASVSPDDGKVPLECALAHRSARVSLALAKVCYPLARTASREPYFVIAACMDMDEVCELLRERTRPIVDEMRARREA